MGVKAMKRFFIAVLIVICAIVGFLIYYQNHFAYMELTQEEIDFRKQQNELQKGRQLENDIYEMFGRH